MVVGDGVCGWPRESSLSPDCVAVQMKNYTFEGVCVMKNYTFEGVCVMRKYTFEGVCVMKNDTFEGVCVVCYIGNRMFLQNQYKTIASLLFLVYKISCLPG